MRSVYCNCPPRKNAIAIKRLPYSIKRLLTGMAFFTLIEEPAGSKIHPVIPTVVTDGGGLPRNYGLRSGVFAG